MAARRAPSTTPNAAAARLAARWATVSLAVTLVSGAWLRLAMVWPAAAMGVDLRHAVHAHSHVAFFGWLVLAAAAVAAPGVVFDTARLRWWRRVVHAIGALSLVAWVAFFRMGYAGPTIALSAVHVGLWIGLARLCWSMPDAAPRRWWRAAFGALVGAGAVTVVPAILAARDVHDGWWRELAIKLFLAAFISGFAGLATMAAVLGAHDPGDRLRWSRRTILAMLVPLGVLYVAGAPPVAWLTLAGRAAAGATGVATLAVVVVVVRQRPTVVWWLPLLTMSAIGGLDLLAAAGVGASLMHGRAITVAFTHAVLLAWVTPTLALVLAPPAARRAAPAARVAVTVGTALAGVMILAVASMGWPWAWALVASFGVSGLGLAWVAALAGLGAAGAWAVTLFSLTGASAPEVSHDVPARAPDPAGLPDAGGALPALRARADGAAAGAPLLAAPD